MGMREWISFCFKWQLLFLQIHKWLKMYCLAFGSLDLLMTTGARGAQRTDTGQTASTEALRTWPPRALGARDTASAQLDRCMRSAGVGIGDRCFGCGKVTRGFPVT